MDGEDLFGMGSAEEQTDAIDRVRSRVEIARGARPPVRYSDLKHLANSPAHYRYRLAFRGEKKRSTDVGSAAHTMILGGQRVIVYEGRRDPRAKEYKAFLEEHKDDLILIDSEYRAAAGIARAVERCKEAVELLEGEREKEIPTWKLCDRPCGGRPDVTAASYVTDLKTSNTSQPDRFARLGLSQGYPGQLAWYVDGLYAHDRRRRDAFIVAVEQAPPHVVTCMQLTDAALEMGRRTARKWLELLLVCEDSDRWPGYVQGVVPFDVPELDDFGFLDMGESA
jgi:hypothetical protein